jgi:hypothetical protein
VSFSPLFRFPRTQWKDVETRNVIERLREDSDAARRLKACGGVKEAAVVLLFGLVVSGQIKLRKIDAWRRTVAVLNRTRGSGMMIR